MKVAIVANPTSGKGKAAAAAKYIERLLQRRGIDAFLNYTDSPQRTTKIANHISFRYNRLIAVGGDGTISGVINGIVGTNCELGIIPTGTANVLAKELEIPEDVEAASAVASTGKVKKIDLGKVNDRYFSLMCGIGFDAQVINEVKPFVKKVFRQLAYGPAIAKTIFGTTPEIILVKIDKSLVSQGYFVVVSNSKHYAGTRSIARKADLSDGYLDVCIFKKGKNYDFLKYTAAVLAGRLTIKDVEYYRAKEVQIESDTPILIQTDGDVVGQTPASITIEPKKLAVVVPNR